MLTDIGVRNAKAADKPQKIFDGKGLYLYVTPAGGKIWRFKYRFGGKEKLLTFGPYPEIGLAEARERHFNARKELVLGTDPGAAKVAEKIKAENTFEVVAREWVSRQTRLSERHADDIIHNLERDIFPTLGSRPISEITTQELLAVVRKVELRGAIETAHKELGVCRRVFALALYDGRVKQNPATDLKGALKPKPRAKNRAAITDPAQFGGFLRTLDGYHGNLIVRCALRLGPLLFVRPGELRAAEWTDIDLEAALWKYHVSKTDKNHVVPLARQALEILREIQTLTGQGKYVFPSARTPDRPMSNNAILAALRRLGVGKEETCEHGYRATANTMLREVLRFPVDLIEHQLTHTVRNPLGRAYDRTEFLEERREMMQRWADYLDEIKDMPT